MGGWWKAPRALADLLARRGLTPNAYALLHFLSESGADRQGGVATTLGFLAASLVVSEKTIHRALVDLRAAGLIDFDDHRGRTVFAVRTTSRLAALATSDTASDTDAAESPTSHTGSDTTSDTASGSGVRGDLGHHFGHPPETDEGQAPMDKRVAADATSDTSHAHARARADRDQDRDTPWGGLAPATSDTTPEDHHSEAQRLVAFYVDRHRQRTGQPAPTQVVGQVAGKVGELLRDGVSPRVVERTLVLLLDRPRLHPSVLPSLVAEAAADLTRPTRPLAHHEREIDEPPVDPEAPAHARAILDRLRGSMKDVAP